MANVTSGNSVSSSAQMGTDVVTLPAMADDSVDKSNIKTGAVGTDEILDGEIVNADISTSAGIVDTKLATISTAGKVSGAALTSLSSIPVGAGAIPTANLPTIGKNGGSGVDGALSITSGATNIDLGGASILVKNYTSISITGTGQLTFTNPHANGTKILLLSQGGVTLTSSATPNIEVSNLGGQGGVSVASSMTLRDGKASLDYLDALKHYGGVSGAGVAVTSRVFYGSSINDLVYTKLKILIPGAGGSSGGSVNSTTGMDGGRGGGALYIECAGALNFTGSIYAKGQVGQGTPGGSQSASGGGAGGSVLILYKTLTAASGTISCVGGNGAGSGQGQSPSGGGGANLVAGGAEGASGTSDTSAGGSAGGGYMGGGGGGAGGYYLIAENTMFA